MDEFQKRPPPFARPLDAEERADDASEEDFRTKPDTASTVGTVLLVLGHAIPWTLLIAVLCRVVPACKKVFADFGMKLPWLTEAIIDFSDLMTQVFVVVALAFLVFLVVDALILSWLRRNRSTRTLARLWFFFMFLVPLAAVCVIAVGLVSPYLELMEGLSK